jgi:hypothetical protein
MFERLYALEDHPGSAEFLARLSWLPTTIAELERFDS